MKIKYDKSADAAYLYLKDSIGVGEVAKTYCCDPVEVQGQINIDFDADGRLVGIEILDASTRLPPEIFESARQ
jgi:uncharacterized protein YuzE